jgi:hypothetical protein
MIEQQEQSGLTRNNIKPLSKKKDSDYAAAWNWLVSDNEIIHAYANIYEKIFLSCDCIHQPISLYCTSSDNNNNQHKQFLSQR